jgi:integrase
MALDPSTVDALRDHRRHQLEERIAAGPAWQDELADDLGTSRTGLVFTWEDGSLIHPERLSAWFRRHCVEAGLPPIRLHDVRHSYASAGLANATGWHEAKIISERLGYANVAITIDTDSHVLPAAGAETAHTLAKLILGGFDVYVSKPRSRRHGQRMPFSRSAWSAVDSRPTRAWRKRQTRWV